MAFFFSSRRRHTRSLRDWSSDVCSSDLEVAKGRQAYVVYPLIAESETSDLKAATVVYEELKSDAFRGRRVRSEERRVGKECRCWWGPHRYKIKRISNDHQEQERIMGPNR